MRDQQLYKSPAIEVHGHCRLLLPWLRVPCWFFLQSGVEKLLGIEPTTLDLSSQSGAYDLLDTADFYLPNLPIFPTRPSSLNFWGKFGVKLSLNSRNRWCFIRFFPWPRFLEMQPMPAFTTQICQFCLTGLAHWISKANSWNLERSSLLTQ